jgi:hypothetical protein
MAKAKKPQPKVVAHDLSEREDRRDVYEGSESARALSKLSPKARRAAGMLARLDRATRREALKAFDGNGDLILPFEFLS